MVLFFFLNSSWFSSTWIYDPFCSIEGFNNLTWKKLKSTDLENSHKRHSNKCKSPLWKYRLLDSLWFCKLRPNKSLHWVNIIMIKITWSLLATSWSWYIERKVKKKILLSRLTRHWAITNFSWLENPKFVNYVWVSVVIFHRRVNDQPFIFFPLLKSVSRASRMICGPCARETVLEVSESLEEWKYWILLASFRTECL